MEFAMKINSIVPAVLALTLALPGLPSFAASEAPLKLLGDPAPPKAAERTITIAPSTKWVNVKRGEIIAFDTGGKTFAWHFDTAETVQSVDLSRVAPPGALDHRVIAYVGINPDFDSP
jgi:hypothetical protein